jgi:hypothetical protein
VRGYRRPEFVTDSRNTQSQLARQRPSPQLILERNALPAGPRPGERLRSSQPAPPFRCAVHFAVHNSDWLNLSAIGGRGGAGTGVVTNVLGVTVRDRSVIVSLMRRPSVSLPKDLAEGDRDVRQSAPREDLTNEVHGSCTAAIT